ncbi:MAG: DUF2971 domain-containing protein [Rhodobacter sp.]|nr:DUF2971 domain-containing protein [Rhodobacter sp.]MCA3521149.1 DUF2971 domain-containing protein [Rhodobacter sp.]MCA3547631.1 DUF2971 domain-containing protein [Rhodobacter sp.]
MDSFEVFFPFAVEATHSAEKRNIDFVHYTSASNALRILETKTVTLRNAALMNDFSEIDYGEKCLLKAWHSQFGRGPTKEEPGKLAKLLAKIYPHLIDRIADHYDRDLVKRKTDTYLLSLAEHDDHTEGKFGRLSMWRAYGGRTNVAVVLDRSPMLRPTNGDAGFTSSVLYVRTDDFPDYFGTFVDGMEKNIEILLRLGEDSVYQNIVQAFNVSAISTKHPGFQEEREWRIIYAPWLQTSDAVNSSVIDIAGVPQRVQQIKLKDRHDVGLYGIEIPQLVKKIIIGPTDTPLVLLDAFIEKLAMAGVQDAERRVTISDIPIRR